MKTTLAYAALAVIATVVITFCIGGVAQGIAAVMVEVGRALSGAK